MAAVKKPKPLRVRKLSSLLAIGLRDLRKQERAKNSKVDMGLWYECNVICTTCMAGSVLRFSMGYGRQKCSFAPLMTRPKFQMQLWALNALRHGWLDEARRYLDIRTKNRLPDRIMPLYDGPDGEWWKAARQLLADLKANGE